MNERIKVLVLGSSGLIGHQVFNHLKSSQNYELYDIAFRRKVHAKTILLDARREGELHRKIKEINPQYIINCIGILIRESELDSESAIYLNSYMPHRLARLADEINSKLIHISTDCVFSGDKSGPYIETDERDGRGVYAKTKGLGEVINDRHLTLRTSVVGPELKRDGGELFHWFMSQSDSIFGFTEAIWSGVTTIELSKAVKWAIESDIVGLYHVTNNDAISKYELLNLFKKYTEKDVDIIPDDSRNTDKSFIDTRLLREYRIPSYDRMIFEMINLIVENKEKYPHYKIPRSGKKTL